MCDKNSNLPFSIGGNYNPKNSHTGLVYFADEIKRGDELFLKEQPAIAVCFEFY